ncbi:MAG: hypothetical protein AMS18_01800, partial [Gemmatimonas sp. SG8_17]
MSRATVRRPVQLRTKQNSTMLRKTQLAAVSVQMTGYNATNADNHGATTRSAPPDAVSSNRVV